MTARSAVTTSPPAEPDSARGAPRHEDTLDVAARLAGAAVIVDQPDERVDEPRAAAARNRHPTRLDRERDHPRHEAGRGGVRAEARVQHPGASRPCARSEQKVSVSQSRLL